MVVPQPALKCPSLSMSHSPPSDPPPPIYHDVADLPTAVRESTDTPDVGVDGVDCQYDLPVSEMDSKYSDLTPVYQEITSYSSTSARVLSRPNHSVDYQPTTGTD